MSSGERAVHVLSSAVFIGLAAMLTACARHEVDAVTQARIFGCLDLAAERHNARDHGEFRLRGLGCADLDPRDVRAVMPAWRAQQRASTRARLNPPPPAAPPT